MYRLFIKCMLTLTFFFTVVCIYPDNEAVAKGYIKRAYLNIGININTAKDFLSKSAEFSKNYPEYYYLLITAENNSGVFANDRDNADGIVAYIKNAFIIDQYELYKKAALVYTRAHEYSKAKTIYKILVGDKERSIYGEMVGYLELLFDSDSSSDIPQVLEMAENRCPGNDILYYKGLFLAKYSEEKNDDIKKIISKLDAQEYDIGRILYLASFIAKSDDFIRMIKDKNSVPDIQTSQKKDIILNLIHNYDGTDDLLLADLYSDWISNKGNSDYRSFSLVNNEISKRIEAVNPDVINQLINYSGERVFDGDGDGISEITYLMKNSIITGKKYDSDQNGIYEWIYNYQENGKILSAVSYTTRDACKVYNFNKYDSSLINVAVYEKKRKMRLFFLTPSSVFFNENEKLPDLNDLKSISQYEEVYDDGTARVRYFDNKIASMEKDRDNDGYYEYKGFFEDGVLSEGLIDTNNDKVFDTLEKYVSGTLSSLYVKSDPFYSGYDYKEFIYPNRTEKYWDEDKDSEFETKCIEFNNKTKNTYYDINFDGTYDYLQTAEIDGTMRDYDIKNGAKILIKQTIAKDKNSKKGWIVLSPKDTALLKVPESIVFSDSRSGIFIYNGVKNGFEDAVITTDDFTYSVMKNKFGIFLFDISQ